MSGHTYIKTTSNLFEDEEVNDETFVNSYRARIGPPPQPKPSAYGGHIADQERQRQVMLQRQKEIEQRTLDSSSRSIGLLRESERIGIATAEELARQHEQLQNTNNRLDEINTNLTQSQKHLNGIKSFFYSLKTYMAGKPDQTPTRSQTSLESRNVPGPSSALNETLDNFNPRGNSEENFNNHPSTRLRGLDQQQAVATPITDSQRVHQVLDANLDEMLHSISRLKGLGMALGEEIETQNELIDTIHDKVEVADIKLNKQTKEINKFLGK